MSDDLIFIWGNFVRGNSIAFKQVYENCFESIYLYGQQFSKDPQTIKDVIQNTFIKVWEKKESLAEVRNPKAYLMQMFRNQMLNLIRFNKNNPLYSTEIDADNYDFKLAVPVELDIIEKERTDEIRKKLKDAFKTLTAKQKEIIYLKYVKGLEFKEISDIMEINTRSAYKLHHRTLLNLKSQLGNIDNMLLLAYLTWYTKEIYSIF